MMGRAGTYPVPPRTPNEPKVGMRTPWGTADSVRKIGTGIHVVGTPGHGGMKLGRYQNSRVDPAWRKAGGWYEEDQEYAIVGLTFGQDAGFSAAAVEDCRSVCRNYFPDAYETIYGVKVTAAESHVVREREAKEAGKGKMQIIACWGDWATNVPPGMVGVFARLDGREGPKGAPEGHYLITKLQYDAGSLPVRLLPDDATPVEGDEPFRDRKAQKPLSPLTEGFLRYK